jgi:hypothetical protein
LLPGLPFTGRRINPGKSGGELKKWVVIVGAAFLLTACTNDGSAESKLDSLGGREGMGFNKGNARELKDRVGERMDRKDSAEFRKDSTDWAQKDSTRK